MMEALINGNYNCNDFSYDMPELMLMLDDADLEIALEDIPEICTNYDPYKMNEPELLKTMPRRGLKFKNSLFRKVNTSKVMLAL